jgi:hypothetical protein
MRRAPSTRRPPPTARRAARRATAPRPLRPGRGPRPATPRTRRRRQWCWRCRRRRRGRPAGRAAHAGEGREGGAVRWEGRRPPDPGRVRRLPRTCSYAQLPPWRQLLGRPLPQPPAASAGSCLCRPPPRPAAASAGRRLGRQVPLLAAGSAARRRTCTPYQVADAPISTAASRATRRTKPWRGATGGGVQKGSECTATAAVAWRGRARRCGVPWANAGPAAGNASRCIPPTRPAGAPPRKAVP